MSNPIGWRWQRRVSRVLVLLTPLIASACGDGREQTEVLNQPVPSVNQFENERNCPKGEGIRLCTELVEIPMPQATLRIPRNYLDEWYVYPQNAARNYALVYLKWPEMRGLVAADKYAAFNVNERVKLVFRASETLTPEEVQKRQKRVEVIQNSSRTDMPDFGLWSYKEGLYFLPKIPVSTSTSVGQLMLTCSGKLACEDLASPTCTCVSYIAESGVSVKVEFSKLHLKDWKRIYGLSNHIVSEALGATISRAK